MSKSIWCKVDISILLNTIRVYAFVCVLRTCVKFYCDLNVTKKTRRNNKFYGKIIYKNKIEIKICNKKQQNQRNKETINQRNEQYTEKISLYMCNHPPSLRPIDFVFFICWFFFGLKNNFKIKQYHECRWVCSVFELKPIHRTNVMDFFSGCFILSEIRNKDIHFSFPTSIRLIGWYCGR